jgi:Protein of unknown function (DUF2852)
MSGSASHGTYGNPAATQSPWGPGSGWGSPGWDYWHYWYAAKPFWIAAMVLGFIFWWPIGLALLFFGMWSKRMAYWGCGRYAWQGAGQRNNWQGGPPPPWAGWKSFWCRSDRRAQTQSSGNRAFDEYRAETLRRLEEEQKEFGAFLDRLRFAKDKAEFDQFMAERRNHRPPASPEQPEPPTGQA